MSNSYSRDVIENQLLKLRLENLELQKKIKEESGFKWTTFIVLFFLFFPAAICYALVKMFQKED